MVEREETVHRAPSSTLSAPPGEEQVPNEEVGGETIMRINNRKLLRWKSKRDKCLALSSTMMRERGVSWPYCAPL